MKRVLLIGLFLAAMLPTALLWGPAPAVTDPPMARPEDERVTVILDNLDGLTLKVYSSRPVLIVYVGNDKKIVATASKPLDDLPEATRKVIVESVPK